MKKCFNLHEHKHKQYTFVSSVLLNFNNITYGLYFNDFCIFSRLSHSLDNNLTHVTVCNMMCIKRILIEFSYPEFHFILTVYSLVFPSDIHRVNLCYSWIYVRTIPWMIQLFLVVL
jgi:hypothetical protein